MKFKVGDIIVVKMLNPLRRASFNKFVVEHLPNENSGQNQGPGIPHYYTCRLVNNNRIARVFYKEHEMHLMVNPNELLKDIL